MVGLSQVRDYTFVKTTIQVTWHVGRESGTVEQPIGSLTNTLQNKNDFILVI